MRLAARAGLFLVLPALACSDPATVGGLLRVSRVDVDPAAANVIIGGSLQLAATPRTGSGIILTDRTVTWSSSNASIATVSESGVVTAIRVGGPVEIRATVEDVPGIANIVISAEPVTRITITPGQASVNTGASTQLQATAFNASGQAVSGTTFSWQSSSPNIADVSTSGIVLGVSAGGPVTITARSGDAAGTTSVMVTQAQAVPNRLAFSQQPPDGTAGQPLGAPVRVAIRDASGNTVTSSSLPVSVRLGNNPGGANLSGTLTVTGSSGVATFSNLVVDRAGNGYTLVAFSGGLTDAISTGFDITAPSPPPPPPPGPASQLAITVQPSSLAVRNLAFAQQPVIQLLDAAGNAVSQSGVQVTAALASGPGNASLGGTRTVSTNSSGAASFTNLSINRSGTFTLRFTASTLQSVTSGSIVIP